MLTKAISLCGLNKTPSKQLITMTNKNYRHRFSTTGFGTMSKDGPITLIGICLISSTTTMARLPMNIAMTRFQAKLFNMIVGNSTSTTMMAVTNG